ncbi:hypothetical protein X801_04597, partial [Opisthorchis viverrini]
GPSCVISSPPKQSFQARAKRQPVSRERTRSNTTPVFVPTDECKQSQIVMRDYYSPMIYFAMAFYIFMCFFTERRSFLRGQVQTPKHPNKRLSISTRIVNYFKRYPGLPIPMNMLQYRHSTVAYAAEYVCAFNLIAGIFTKVYGMAMRKNLRNAIWIGIPINFKTYVHKNVSHVRKLLWPKETYQKRVIDARQVKVKCCVNLRTIWRSVNSESGGFTYPAGLIWSLSFLSSVYGVFRRGKRSIQAQYLDVPATIYENIAVENARRVHHICILLILGVNLDDASRMLEHIQPNMGSSRQMEIDFLLGGRS